MKMGIIFHDLGSECIDAFAGGRISVQENNDPNILSKAIVDRYRKSSEHWKILMSGNCFIGVGIGPGGNSINLDAFDIDKIGYLHRYLDEKGNPCSERVKY